ncbi:MAG: four helix bundle protein [Ignavibacteriales bacterium]|nr:four helix bundle protein [Ignavibacteriales bacterium]
MALTEELPIYKATYDLVLVIFSFVKNFNKEYKYTIGESIKKEAIEVVTNVYRANCTQDKTIHLTKARENIEVIRLYIRLLKDLHQINVKQLVFVNVYIENVSKQLTGWQKAQKNPSTSSG